MNRINELKNFLSFQNFQGAVDACACAQPAGITQRVEDDPKPPPIFIPNHPYAAIPKGIVFGKAKGTSHLAKPAPDTFLWMADDVEAPFFFHHLNSRIA